MNTKHSKADLVPLMIADIYQLAGDFREQGESIARAIGQTQARWQSLSAASAESRTVPQIARRLGVSRQAVQRLANDLVTDGLATFEPNPDHQGSPYLIPTSAGRADLAHLSKAARALHADIAATLSASELRNLHHGLRRLIAVLEHASSKPRRSPAKE